MSKIVVTTIDNGLAILTEYVEGEGAIRYGWDVETSGALSIARYHREEGEGARGTSSLWVRRPDVAAYAPGTWSFVKRAD